MIQQQSPTHSNGPKPDKAKPNMLMDSLGGGLSGAAAMACQVTGLMWMRTVMNYQYRYGGGNFFNVLRTLVAEGGLARLYRGYPQAMAQAPLSRFGDAAANQAVLNAPSLQNQPVALKTALASLMAGTWRLALMPIDAWKTVKQVEGHKGSAILLSKIKTHGIGVLYHGMGATFAATITGHYPWFVTYNYLSQALPKPSRRLNAGDNARYNALSLLRQAFIGFSASVISDTITNSLRVVKTVKQTSAHPITYVQSVKQVLDHHNGAAHGLFFRGLGTRLAVNGIQGLTFSVLWKLFMDQFPGMTSSKS